MISNGRKPKLIILKKVNFFEWRYWEKFYIKKYNGIKLTNITQGGDGGILESKYEKISLKYWKKVAQIDVDSGKIIKIFLNISDAANQIKAKSRSRISDCCHGKIYTASGYIWRFLDKTGNIIEKNKNLKDFKGKKRVVKIDISTNKTLKQYKSLTDASNQNKIDVGGISSCCLGKLYSSGGFVWRFIDENDKIVLPKIKKNKTGCYVRF